MSEWILFSQANRYNCPPGLAYDQVTRGCKWADQVPECASPVVVVDEEGGEFQVMLASDWSALIT